MFIIHFCHFFSRQLWPPRSQFIDKKPPNRTGQNHPVRSDGYPSRMRYSVSRKRAQLSRTVLYRKSVFLFRMGVKPFPNSFRWRCFASIVPGKKFYHRLLCLFNCHFGMLLIFNFSEKDSSSVFHFLSSKVFTLFRIQGIAIAVSKTP